MDDGLTVWAIGCLVCVGNFLVGLRFARMEKMPFRSIEWFGRTISDPVEVRAKVNLLGRFFMLGAPLFLMLWTALAFGVLGSVEGMPPINPG
jgi:hypothetical protein